MLMQNSIINGICEIVAWHHEKTTIMKNQTTHYEILLLTGTSFAARQYCCRKDDKENGRKFSSMEELEKACWDGMLYEIFPELLGGFSVQCKCFIWHIMRGKNYLKISLGPAPAVMENKTAIDPYIFLLAACEN
jgi:hypothetical protein